MRIGALYSHLNGLEWMKVHQPRVWKEIQAVIKSIDARKYVTKISKEKTKFGALLYSPNELNAAIRTEFEKRGWNEVRYRYMVTDDYRLTTTIMRLAIEDQERMVKEAGKSPMYSYNQTDFQKNRVAVEVQLGKYSFIEFDLFVKHLGFFIGDSIDVGVEIVPTKQMLSQMSSGPGYFERALHQVARQGRGAPPVPLVIIGFEEDHRPGIGQRKIAD